MAKQSSLQLTQSEDVSVVHLARNVVDRLFIRDLFDELADYVEQEKPRKLLINFDQVTHFSSEAIGGLIRVARRIRALGGEIKLCDMSPDIRGIFQLTNLDGTVFSVYDSAREALAEF